jgi:hypothetical protein
MNNFLDVKNMMVCVSAFEDHMKKNFKVDVIKTFPYINCRLELVNIMKYIKASPEFVNFPLNKLNNICLNKLRDMYINKCGLVDNNTRKPNMRPLERDQQLYGQRNVSYANMTMPLTSTPDNLLKAEKEQTEFNYQQALNARNLGFNKSTPTFNLPTVKENKLDINTFQKQLDFMEEERKKSLMFGCAGENDCHFQDSRNIQMDLKNQENDPKTFFENLMATPPIQNETVSKSNENELDNIFNVTACIDNPHNNVYETKNKTFDNDIEIETYCDNTTKTNYDSVYDQKNEPPKYTSYGLNTLQQEPDHLKISPSYYLTINGYDRDWVKQKQRFHFTLNPTELSNNYKNILEMSLTKLIIPSEITNDRSITNPIPKSSFVHNFKLSVPYVCVHIDELNSSSDGFHDTNRKAFTTFIHDSDYHGGNGRGYTIMKPMQDEKRVFEPSPLSALPRLTMKIMNPNGTLFNYSKDHFNVWKLEYGEHSRQYMKIILDKFYDKNEFYKGDNIYIKNFKIPYFDTDVDEYDTDSSEYTAYQEYRTNSYNYNKMMDFMNRPEGHEILEIGKPNKEGHYHNFLIRTPGEFNYETGRFDINMELMNLLKSHNENNFAYTVNLTPTGNIINTSLQPTVALQLKTTIGNASKTIYSKMI